MSETLEAGGGGRWIRWVWVGIALILMAGALLAWRASTEGGTPQPGATGPDPSASPPVPSLYFVPNRMSWSGLGWPATVGGELGNVGGIDVMVEDLQLAQSGVTLIGAYRGEEWRPGGTPLVPPPLHLRPGERQTVTLVIRVADCAVVRSDPGTLELTVSFPGRLDKAAVSIALADRGVGNLLGNPTPEC